jgi:predicted MPP superfamily phosphohydrolase
MMRFLVLFVVFLGFMGVMNFYVYRRFLRKLTHVPPWFALIVPLVLMLGELLFVIELLSHALVKTSWMYSMLSASVGITFLLFVIAIAYDMVVTASSKVPLNQERRQFIKVIFDITMLIAAFSYLLRGLSDGLRFPPVRTQNVTIKDFPFEHYSIVQLSDVHVGRTIQRDFIEYLVEKTNDLKPDLVVITGDLLDLPVTMLNDHLEPLRDIKAPVYFVLGNHEYFHGAESILDYLRTLGIMPLLNDSVLIGNADQGFHLIGVNDLTGARMGYLEPDMDQAYSIVNEQKPCVVLSHQPKSIDLFKGRRCDLMLSGHTHGGQIFPFGLLVMMDQPYLAGLYQHSEKTQVFVSRGAGYWGPPIRILAPSEINQLQIRPA